jgi:ribosomal protein L37AE/L43A
LYNHFGLRQWDKDLLNLSSSYCCDSCGSWTFPRSRSMFGNVRLCSGHFRWKLPDSQARGKHGELTSESGTSHRLMKWEASGGVIGDRANVTMILNSGAVRNTEAQHWCLTCSIPSRLNTYEWPWLDSGFWRRLRETKYPQGIQNLEESLFWICCYCKQMFEGCVWIHYANNSTYELWWWHGFSYRTTVYLFIVTTEGGVFLSPQIPCKWLWKKKIPKYSSPYDCILNWN